MSKLTLKYVLLIGGLAALLTLSFFAAALAMWILRILLAVILFVLTYWALEDHEVPVPRARFRWLAPLKFW